MPYHAMGVSKSEALGTEAESYPVGLEFAVGWQRAFAELGCDVKQA